MLFTIVHMNGYIIPRVSLSVCLSMTFVNFGYGSLRTSKIITVYD